MNEQFYFDDSLGATNTATDAVATLGDTKDALQRFNIRLHKICSSSAEFVAAFPESEVSMNKTKVQLEKSSQQTALSLTCDVTRDRILIRSDLVERSFTRRGILATVNSVFDPLGICAPVVLDGKHKRKASQRFRR